MMEFSIWKIINRVLKYKEEGDGMLNKDTKTTLFMYSHYECSALEEYLEKMAEKGWLLQSIKGIFFNFKKTEIKKIKYSADALHRVSVFDHKDSDLALEYREYCEAAGWTYICEDVKTQIFYTQGEKEAISIHTDEEEKFKVVFKSSITTVGAQMCLIALFICSFYIQVTDNTELFLASNSGTIIITIIISAILINSIEIIDFYIWVIKAKGRLKKNKLIIYNSYKQLKRKNILLIACNLIVILIVFKFFVFDNYGSNKLSIILVLIMGIPIIATRYINKITSKKKYSKDINIAITLISSLVLTCLVFMIAFSNAFGSVTNTKKNEVLSHKANLIFMDFAYEKNQDKNSNIEFDESIFASRTKYLYQNENNYLVYTIFQSEYPWLIKLDENRLVNRSHKSINYKLETTKLPSNIRVYVTGDLKNSFVLVSEDKVVEIRKGFTGISKDEFLNKVYKKLFNY